MNMVEKVARATFHAECDSHKEETGYKDLWDWLDVMPAVRDRHMAMARAAIMVMVEPSEGMIEAVEKAEEEAGYIAAAYESIDWQEAWPVAIRAALGEK